MTTKIKLKDIVLLFLGISISLSLWHFYQLTNSYKNQYNSRIAANELKQSSDDLTRMVRTYTLTNDPRYEKMYWDILAIRNGEKARPFRYEDIYWDYVVATGKPPRKDGNKISLHRIMEDLKFSKDEFLKLKEAQNTSNKLVETEMIAMHAMKGEFLDEEGNFTIKKEPDFDFARSILYNKTYHQEKINIMDPIDQFFVLLNKRLTTTIKNNLKITIFYITIVFSSLFLLFLITKKEIQDQEKEDVILKNKHKTIEEDSEKVLSDYKNAHKKLQETNQQLIQSEKMASIGQLAAGVAHEINNPVGFISSNMQTLEEYVANYSKYLRVVETLKGAIEENNTEKVHLSVEELKKLEEDMNLSFIMIDMDDLLRESQAGIERIKKIVLDLRTFSREGQDTYELVKIEEVIDGVLNIVHSEIKYKAELKKEYGETPLIKCNAQRLGQVFINLLVNAAQSIKEKGVIGVKTYAQDKNMYIEIRDTGEGIEEEKLKDIFNPFYTTKPVGKGTGLGLSISYDIVKQHNGELTVESEVGKGTIFIIMLPMV